MTLMIILISCLGIIVLHYGTKVITERIGEHLKSVVVLKEDALNGYLRQEVRNLESLAREPWILEEFGMMTEYLPSTEIHQEHHSRIKINLLERINDQQDVLEYFFMNPEGLIHLSTSTEQEGKIKTDRPYFIVGMNHSFIQSFYYSLAIREPAITISTPLKNHEGKLLGVLAARINLNKVSEIMMERSGLGESGETILINKYNLLVSKSRFEEGLEFRRTIYSEAAKECVKGNSGLSKYQDYRGVKVLGYYGWDEERDVCFAAKIDEVEAMTPVQELKNLIFLVSLSMIVIFSLLGMVFARTITKPLIKLKEVTMKFGKDKVEEKINLSSKDEIGELAVAFKNMIANLKKSQGQLGEYTKELEKKVKIRTQELEDSKKVLEKKVKESKNTEMATLNILEDVEESREKLKELDKMKTEFLSTVSHELRTPITPIKSQVQRLLQREMPLKERREALEMVLRNTVRLDRLIQDVLELSRIQSKRLTIFLRREDLLGLIKENIRTMDNLAKDAGVKIVLEHDHHGGDHHAWIDRDRITEVLINLIDNAVKYSGSKEVIVQIKRKARVIFISVIDKGVGIPEEEKVRMFEPFFRGKVGLEKRPEGTGLGLSICKGIVESHGGKMWVESAKDKGTTFSFTLPIKGNGTVKMLKKTS